ncbi:MAG: carbohydrate-binding family 9-like protein, partial [Sphaerochaeta sp.]
MITIYSRPLAQTLPISLIPLWGEYEGVEASVRMAWENQLLHLRYQVREPQLRRMVTEHNGRVWEDSCVEAFLQREGQEVYVNVECSASLSMLAGRGEGRANRTLFPPDFIQTIDHTVEILENSNKQSRWTLEVSL